jgi:PKD repeat protein
MAEKSEGNASRFGQSSPSFLKKEILSAKKITVTSQCVPIGSVVLMIVALFMGTISLVLIAAPANAEHRSVCVIEIVTGWREPQDENDVFRLDIYRIPIIVDSASSGYIADGLGVDAELVECTPLPHESSVIIDEVEAAIAQNVSATGIATSLIATNATNATTTTTAVPSQIEQEAVPEGGAAVVVPPSTMPPTTEEEQQPLSASFGIDSTNGDTAPATFLFEADAQGGTEPYTYTWDFGDGQTGDGISIHHTFEQACTYDVTLTVTDSAGQTASESREVNVRPATITEEEPSAEVIIEE